MKITTEILLQYADKKLNDPAIIKTVKEYVDKDPELQHIIKKLQISKVLMSYMKEICKHGRI